MSPANNNRAEPVSIKSRLLSPATLISFGVAMALIVFLATRFDLDWAATWDNVRSMNPWLYLVAFLLYYLSFVFRGARWRLLARNAGIGSSTGNRLPSVLQCSRLVVIGWFVNGIAWLRLGDPYRAYAFSEESGDTFSGSLGTIFAERVLDMATVFAVLVVSAILLTTTTDSDVSTYILVAASGMAAALAAVILMMKGFGVRLAGFLPNRLKMAYGRFQQGTLGSFKQLPVILVLGLAGWLLEMARIYFVIQALNLDVPLALVPVVALGHAILSTVPTPGGVGAVEPGVTGLLLFELQRDAAVSVAVVDRSITYISVLLIGGLVFMHRQVARTRQSRPVVGAAQVGEQGESGQG